MTSTHRRMLQGLLSLAVVAAAAGVRAQNLEAPGAPAAAAAPATATGPSGWGDGGQMVLSAENLFGFNYNHPSGNAHATTFGLFSNAFAGVGQNTYEWPRLAFDTFVIKGISAGGAISYARTTYSDAPPGQVLPASLNAVEIAPRLGYAQMVGPWLGVWPRAGVTYVYSSSSQKFLALTIDALAAVIVSPHLAVTFGPNLNVGLTGAPKITTVGAFFGLAITI
jgi:hypothetical protein